MRELNRRRMDSHASMKIGKDVCSISSSNENDSDNKHNNNVNNDKELDEHPRKRRPVLRAW